MNTPIALVLCFVYAVGAAAFFSLSLGVSWWVAAATITTSILVAALVVFFHARGE